MNYYLSTHMPLVQSTWESYGLLSWKVVNLTHILGNEGLTTSEEQREYSVQVIATWKDREGLERGLKEKGDVVFGDIKNFNKEMPRCFVVGDVVGSSEGEGGA